MEDCCVSDRVKFFFFFWGGGSLLESIRANDGSGNELRAISFDPLEVLDYLENGFTSSTLDRWFIGPIPPVSPSDAITQPFGNVKAVIETARSFLNKKSASATDGHGQSPHRRKPSCSPVPSSEESTGSVDISVVWHFFNRFFC